MPKIIVDEFFSVSFNSGCRKKLFIRGVNRDVFSQIFRLTVPENLYRNFMCFTDFGYRKLLYIRGVGRFSLSETFVSQC